MKDFWKIWLVFLFCLPRVFLVKENPPILAEFDKKKKNSQRFVLAWIDLEVSKKIELKYLINKKENKFN